MTNSFVLQRMNQPHLSDAYNSDSRSEAQWLPKG